MALKKDKIMLGNGFPVLPDFESMETGEATKQDIYDTQGIIAYVQKTLKADQAYTAGDSFIYSGKLYTVTANIAKDANIVLEGAGANAELSEDLVTHIEAIPEYSLDYSTTETDTGAKWLDGKPIYRKVYSFVELPAASRLTVGTITDLDFCVRLYGVAYKESNRNFRPLPFAGTKVDGSGNTICNDIRLIIANNNTIEVETFVEDWDNYTGYIVVEYTKTAV